MKRNTLRSGFEVSPKTIYGQNVLYNNMSHHYRKLYSAKPCVDTSAPISYKVQKQKERNICSRSTNPPNSVAKGQGCSLKKPQVVKKNPLLIEDCCRYRSQLCSQKDPLDDIKVAPFQPRILKTDVQSKIRSYREYHPPRKKNHTGMNGQNTTVKRKMAKFCEPVHEYDQDPNYVEYEDDCDWLQPSHQQDAVSASKQSSSDSAYTEEGEGMWSGGESRDESPQQIYPKNWSTKMWSDDHLYIKFLRTVTDEVLRKGIYTNKSLKCLFQEHINKNKHRLDIKRMEKEVVKLQKDLGIPLDDDLNDLDFGLGSGSGLPQNFVEFSDYAKIIDSVDELSINQKDSNNSKPEEWLSAKHSSSWNDLSDEIRLPLKLPSSDNDNDSISGGEMLTSSTDKNSSSKSIKIVKDR